MSSTFQELTDYFGAAIAGKVELIHSDSGESIATTEGSNGGPIDAVDAGGVLMNPVCVYEIVADVTLSFLLGKAWAGVKTSGVLTRSGYMLTDGTIDTRTGVFPRLTLRAVANEGANAINTWAVSVPLIGRARAQNLLGAISGGGDLQTFQLVAHADPVVPYEAQMPCASDIVHGKLTAAATTAAYAGENAPAAGTGWTLLGAPKSGDHIGYRTFEITTEKAL